MSKPLTGRIDKWNRAKLERMFPQKVLKEFLWQKVVYVAVDDLELGSPLGKMPPMVFKITKEQIDAIEEFNKTQLGSFKKTEFGRDLLKHGRFIV